MSLTIGSLFSGIGGLELGLERAGLGPVLWQVERDPFCLRVLEKHWPNCRRFDDVVRFADDLERAPLLWPAPDIVCGGFPCQDISVAGKGAGLDGERSGLWREFARIIRALRPRFVVVENVSALLARGLGRVLGDLAALGYDAEWHCIRASDVGAPHRRERLFIVAYSDGDRVRQQPEPEPEPRGGSPARSAFDGSLVANPTGLGRVQGRPESDDWRRAIIGCNGGEPMADAHRKRQSQLQGCLANIRRWPVDSGAEVLGYTDCPARRPEARATNITAGGTRVRIGEMEPRRSSGGHCWPPTPGDVHAWGSMPPDAQPSVCRIAHGIPGRVDRLRALGNAVVPQVAEVIGRRVMALAQEAA